MEREKKAKQRLSRNVPSDVPDKKVLPPSPYPSPYPSPPPSPVPIDRVGTDCPPPSETDPFYDEPVTPPQDHMAVVNLVNQFKKQCQWTGPLDPVYQHLISGLEIFRAEEISEEITRARKADKPWDVLDKLKRRKAGIPEKGGVDPEAMKRQIMENLKDYDDTGKKIR